MAAGNVSDQSALDLLSSPVWRSNARRGKGWLLKIEKKNINISNHFFKFPHMFSNSFCFENYSKKDRLARLRYAEPILWLY